MRIGGTVAGKNTDTQIIDTNARLGHEQTVADKRMLQLIVGAAACNAMKTGMVALTLLLFVSPGFGGERPHPQLTYGAIVFTHAAYRLEQLRDAHRSQSSCWHGWTEKKDGSLHYMACLNGPSLLEDLGELAEDDPYYEGKKAMLIRMINESRRSKSSKR